MSLKAIRRQVRALGTGLLVGLAPPSCLRDPNDDSGFAAQRRRMVDEQIEARGVRDARVLRAMRRVERHRFVPEPSRSLAYADRPLPIGFEQTISQPYIVAAMSELARIEPHERVLEIGTGSGYGAAVLAELAREVYTIEILPALAGRARAALAEAGYRNVEVRAGDGYHGWPEHAPFDAILVTAAPPEVPAPLLEQLATGGRLVIPVGVQDDQVLEVWERTAQGVRSVRKFPVRFVPLVRE